ncbi:2-dehydro-3-deoxygalactonokinase [Shimia sp.]|uniref:2-dehydro-3-deoxygalactonokinase n=1 Tax=Shimia sp. TaxID=1954381 RepID=UPI0032993B7E
MNIKAEWIAVDWGTSRLRVWAMQGHKVLAQAQSDKGMGHVNKGAFEAAFLELVEDWLGAAPIDVIACGMVGARQGWAEAPYATVPATPLPEMPVRVPGTDARMRVYIVPGLRQLKPADVMRGEETQIAGFLAQNPNWDGVICLPGTHTKWAQISANEVVSYQTFMTGEMYALLSSQSVLRHSIGQGWDEAAFQDSLAETLSRPESLAARLFGLRAKDLLEGQAGDTARARLSGLLIGAELAASRPYWLGQRVAVIGADTIAKVYASALQPQGAPVTILDCNEMTIAGLIAARKHVRAMA